MHTSGQILNKKQFVIRGLESRRRDCYKMFVMFSAIFVLSFMVASTFAPVNPSAAESTITTMVKNGQYSLSVTSATSINLDIGQPAPAGKLVSAKDELAISANTPSGYKLYLSMGNALEHGNRLYRDGDTASTFLEPNQDSAGVDIAPTAPAKLATNSWGYTVDSTAYNEKRYSAVPLYGSTSALVSAADVSGDYTQDVYFAANVNTAVPSGNYTGSILYTIISEEVPEIVGDIDTMWPVSGVYNSANTATIKVNLPATFSSVATNSNITTTIGGSTCTNPVYAVVAGSTTNGVLDSTDTNYQTLTITCTIPTVAKAKVGAKDLVVAIGKYGTAYTKENAFTYTVNTMQKFTASDCTNLAESTESADNRLTLTDSRDGKAYQIARLADGNCWMVSNLALDGMDENGNVRTLKTTDSNVTKNRKLAVNIENGTPIDSVVQIYSGEANESTTACDLAVAPYCVVSDVKYGNLYNWYAATAGVGDTGTDDLLTTESVCPLNWRLPDSGERGEKKSWSYLVINYSYIDNGVEVQYSKNNIKNGNAVIRAQKPPLYFTLAGRYNDNKGIDGAGKNGGYWTRYLYTTDSRDNAYDMRFNATDGVFNPYGLNEIIWGRSVRCIFGS